MFYFTERKIWCRSDENSEELRTEVEESWTSLNSYVQLFQQKPADSSQTSSMLGNISSGHNLMAKHLSVDSRWHSLPYSQGFLVLTRTTINKPVIDHQIMVINQSIFAFQHEDVTTRVPQRSWQSSASQQNLDLLRWGLGILFLRPVTNSTQNKNYEKIWNKKMAKTHKKLSRKKW